MQSEYDPTGFKRGTVKEDIEAGQRLIDEQAEADRLKRQQEIQQEQPTAQPQQEEPSTEGNNFVEELGSAVGKGLLGAGQSVAFSPERYSDMIVHGDSNDKDEVDADWKPDFDPLGLSDVKDPLVETWWGNMVERVVHYGALTGGVFATGAALTAGAPVTLPALAVGAIVGGTAAALSHYSQREENISSLIVEKIPQLSPIFGHLAVKEKDHPLMKTFKTVVEDMGIGMIVDKVFTQIGGNGAEIAAKRAKNVDDLTLEKAKVEMDDPGFRGHKNKPIADSSQGSPNSTGTPGRVYKQLNLIDDLGEDLGSTDAVFTPTQLERMVQSNDLTDVEYKQLAQKLVGDTKYQQMVASAKKKGMTFAEVHKHTLRRTQEVLGRHTTGMSPEEFWQPLLKNQDKTLGLENMSPDNLAAADLINASLFKKLRDHGIAGRELFDYQDVFAEDGIMKTIADQLVVGLGQAKKTRYLWGASGQVMQLTDPAARFKEMQKVTKNLASIHDETVDGVRLMMQFLKDSPSDELAQGILEVFSMNNKIHNWTDFNAWMRQKIVGGEFNGKVQTGQMVKELQGMMVNSVLSGPKTPLRAIMGTTSNAYLNSFNTALGALVRAPFTGDTTTLRASAASLKSMAEIIPDAWKLFKTKVDAYWTGDIATIRNRYQEYQPLDVNWELMGKWAYEEGTVGERAAFNIANVAKNLNSNTWLTYSTRIMAATDDTFRYIMAKSRSREKALREALDAKAAGDIFDITPDILKQAEDLEYKKLLTPDGDLNLSKDSYLNSQFKEVTLTSELGVMGKNLDQVFNDAPFLKPFFLFARTGINGLKVSAKNSPLVSMLLKESRDIAFGTVDDLPKLAKYGIETAADLANAKALFAGRQALGMASMIPISQKYLAGELTGNGPTDHSMKQTWIDTGWQPRSMKIGDVWVSYDSFEPWNLVLASIADIGDNQKLMGDEWAEDRMWRTAMAVGLANPASKTYLQGINQLIDFVRGQPGSGERVIANLLNNTLPMSSLRNEIGKVITPYMRELNSGVGQSIRNRNLWAEKFTKNELPIKYDMLNGDPIKKWNFMQRMVNGISPVTFNIDKKSKGRTLLWNSGYDLRLVTFSAPDGTSLKDSPTVRSMLQKAIGAYNLEDVLNQLAERDDVKASMERMDYLRRTGQYDLNPDQSFLHLDLIKMHIEEAKRQGWAAIQHEPEVRELLEKQAALEYRQRREKHNTQNYSSPEKDPLTMRNK